jgi:acyl-CoA thioester hydrolase
MMKDPVSLTLRIDWSELDLFGHVNNVAFFKYIQAARVHFWEESGIYQWLENHQCGPILASCNCDFKKPLYYPGHILIHTHLDFIKQSSFGFRHILLDDQGHVAAEAKDVMVMFDFAKKETILFPEPLRVRLGHMLFVQTFFKKG